MRMAHLTRQVYCDQSLAKQLLIALQELFSGRSGYDFQVIDATHFANQEGLLVVTENQCSEGYADKLAGQGFSGFLLVVTKKKNTSDFKYLSNYSFSWQSVKVASEAPKAMHELCLAIGEAVTAMQQLQGGEAVRLQRQLKELNAIGAALSTEKDLNTLLEKILAQARAITMADSGSLYLVEQHDDASLIRFKLAQNDSIDIGNFSEFTLPVNRQSIVGYVVLTGEPFSNEDVYQLSGEDGFSHNRSFDEKCGYRTKSMLVVPMRDQQDIIIGLLQLINKKPDDQLQLKSPKHTEEVVSAFSTTDYELVASLASQASVAIENAKLYQDIQNLFEGFIRASVTAIEARDPTTSGHSERVATLTCGLAEVVDKQVSGRFKDIFIDDISMRELRYASLLHDFGKIGVQEQVLVKAKKLYPHHIAIIKHRFDLIRRTIELDTSKSKTQLLIEKSRDEIAQQLSDMDSHLTERLADLDRYLTIILKSAEPTVLAEGDFEALKEIAAQKFVTFDGQSAPYLGEEEVRFLSIRKGSLSEQERLAIESHVTHSYNFLRQIPWTKDLRNVPSIAYAHHEKLDGSGYPRGIVADDIPFQTKIMTLTDIFDALSARDRPYKKAVPVPRALDILQMEVDEGKLDNDLLKLFIEAKVFEKVFS